ncbi:ABC transporter substrate-binding protein [Martelella alba]|uniref:Thiamine pyrimidine synthase n=1 Tax=Martelella alba TaxID=2590451 RepID=A0A506UCT5_9HYPH|nr:ABC transporter substrate-binding protein [Martelella alba]TPW30479.1 ABC transporter substrate-binding protein [Martelella alba]
MNILDKSTGRRQFLKAGAGLAGLAAIPAFMSAPARAADYGKIGVQLSWVANTEFAGEFFADANGYYKDQGFTGVDIIPGGPSAAPAEIGLMQKKVFYGISLPDLTAAAIAKGATVKTVGVQYQKNPFCIASLKSNPITTPEEMIGKKIGVQAVNETTWNLFLKLNNIDPASINKIPAQFDPTPLAVGDVDGWMSFSTNEPISLALKGVETEVMMFADHNFELVSETIVVHNDSIANERDKVKAMLKAEILGWKQALKDPEGAAKLAVEVYGKSLGLPMDEQIMQAKAQNELLVSPYTDAHGILTISPELIARNIEILKANGFDLTADQLFDMSLLDEVYAEDPSLKA